MVSTCIIKTFFSKFGAKSSLYLISLVFFLFLLSSGVASHFLSYISLITSLIFNFQINLQICLSFQADVGDLSTSTHQ